MLQDLGNFIGDKLQSLFNKRVTDETIETLLNDICDKLITNNVKPSHVEHLKNDMMIRIKEKPIQTNANKVKYIQNIVFESLIEFIDPKTETYKIEKGTVNVIVFVGLQGAGKTTSICKYANFYKKRGFKVGIVCADTYRAGALDQIKQNCSKINIPFFGSDNPDAVEVAKTGVIQFKIHNFELILVDTSGRHTEETELFKEMEGIVKAIQPNNIVFVMDAGIGQSAEEQAMGFKKSVKVGGIILTKIDGASKAGGALSSVAATGCPIEFIGSGEDINSLEQFNPNRFISKLLGKGDIEGLFEKFSLLDIDEEEAMNKFMKGTMTLGDYYGYFKQMLSLGSISSLLNMIPGVKNIKIPDESKFKRMTYAFDSISKSELNSFGDLFVKEPNRLKRISRGSGISIDELNETIQNYKLINQFSKKLLNNQNLKNLSESNHLRNQVSEYLGFNFDDMMDDLEKFKSKKTDDFNDLS